MNVSRKNFGKGFTLIELLVAVVVGTILLGGLIQIFVLTKNNYRVQQGLNYMQENLRFAAGEVGYSARMAGYFFTIAQPIEAAATGPAPSAVFASTSGSGNVQRSSELTVLQGTGANPGCDSLSWTVGLQGFNGGATPPACVDAGNYVLGTDSMIATYLRPVFVGLPAITTPAFALGGPVAAATQAASTGDVIPREIYAIVFDPESKGDVAAKQGGLIGTGAALAGFMPRALFYDTSETSLIAANGVAPANLIKRAAAMMPMQAELFYVRPCSVLENTSAVCTVTSDGGNPQPTLMRRNLLGGAAGGGADEAIVSGIEQFQLEYLATGCAGYLSAVDIAAWTGCLEPARITTATQRWQRVISVRAAFVARSNERSNEIDAATYVLSTDTPAYNPGAIPTLNQLPLNNRYIRRVMVNFSQTRNAVRPLPALPPAPIPVIP